MLTARKLAAGLNENKQTVYTTPTSTVTYIKKIHIFNASLTTQTVTISIGVTPEISLVTFDLSPETVFTTTHLILEASDTLIIEGTVNYIITGAEESCA